MAHPGAEFRAVMFQDPENWQRINVPIGQAQGPLLVGYARGNPLTHLHSLVCHGCPLSLAYKIIRENSLIAGTGHHYKKSRTVHGIFVISHGRFFNRLGHARDRGTAMRDTEWDRDGPTGWSTPCVLVFPVALASVTKLKMLGPTNNQVQKSALEMAIGT